MRNFGIVKICNNKFIAKENKKFKYFANWFFLNFLFLHHVVDLD